MNRRYASEERRSRRILSPTGLPAAAFCLGLLAAPPLGTSLAAPANRQQDSLTAKVASSIGAVTKEKSPAVLRVRSLDSHGEINGTGFMIDPSGTICTLAEIVRNARSITVIGSGWEAPARLEAVDERSGIAFLKMAEEKAAAGGGHFIAPRPVTDAAPMTPVLGLGIPREGIILTSLGLITGRESHVGERYFCVSHLTARIPLAEGEGGSPVLDLTGGLIGMVMSGNSRSASCSIIPSAAIEKLHRDLIRYGRPNPGWVGAVIDECAVPVADSKARVGGVLQGSPAELAGIRAGDIILSLGDRRITAPEDVLEASFFLEAGQSLRITVARSGENKTFTVNCTAIPDRETAKEEASSLPFPLPKLP